MVMVSQRSKHALCLDAMVQFVDLWSSPVRRGRSILLFRSGLDALGAQIFPGFLSR